jgi:hypothetical protein
VFSASPKLEINSVVVVLVNELEIFDGSLVYTAIEVEYKGLDS